MARNYLPLAFKLNEIYLSVNICMPTKEAETYQLAVYICSCFSFFSICTFL